MKTQDIQRAAYISACGKYRYVLARTWDQHTPAVNWIMLNPSTADATEDDPTVRRCVNYTRDWGYGGIIVTNLFALRATDPRKLIGHPDPIGRENDLIIRTHAAMARYYGLVVCAWGANKFAVDRGLYVHQSLIRLSPPVTPCVLGVTGAGHPVHPLYQSASLRPYPWQRYDRPSGPSPKVRLPER